MAKRMTKEERERRKRQRQAARAVKRLLTRLRKGCEQFESVDSWIEYVRGKVKPVADDFEDVLPEDTVRAMRTAGRLLEGTLAAVRTACKVLTSELEKALVALAAGAVGAGLLTGGLAPFVVGGAVVFAALVVGVAVFIVASGSKLTLINKGCPPIDFPKDLGIVDAVPGVDLPDRVDTDEEAEISFPALRTRMRAKPGQLEFSVLGISLRIPLDSAVQEIKLDGQPTFSKGEKEITAGEHVLVLDCG